MASTIVVPARPDVGAYSDAVNTAMVTEKSNYDGRLADAVVDGFTAAVADIEALQAGTSIAGVNGTTIAAGGALTTGQVLRATGAAAAGWGAVNLAAAAAVTGILPAGNFADAVAGAAGGVRLAGDLAGTGSAAATPRVGAINSATVPAGGALTTGNVLQVTGASALGYAAVNLAGGANFVTGALPGANMATAVAGVSAGAVSAADQTHINSTPTIQEATVTLVAGTATINTVITLGATSRIICNPVGAITGSANYASCRELFASRVNGGAGVATAVIEAVASDGVKDADAAGDVHLIILTPHA